MTKTKLYDLSQDNYTDIKDMSVEEIWARIGTLENPSSLEVIIDKIIKRLPPEDK